MPSGCLGTESQFGEVEKLPEMDGGGWPHAVQMHFMPLNGTLTNGNMVKCIP